MNDQEPYAHSSKHTTNSRRSKKRSYLEDLSPFVEKNGRSPSRDYNRPISSRNGTYRRYRQDTTNEFRYTKDEYQESITEVYNQVQNFAYEDDLNHYYRDCDEYAEVDQGSIIIKEEHYEEEREYYNPPATRSNQSSIDSSSYKPYRPSFANLKSYSEKLKEISNIMLSEKSNKNGGRGEQVKTETLYHISKSQSGKFKSDNSKGLGLNECSTPKLSTRSKLVDDKENYDYSRTIRNVPQRELLETKRSKVSHYSKPNNPKSSPLSSINKFSRFQTQEEKIKAFEKIKCIDELGGSFISSHKQTINDDTLLDEDDYSKFLSNKSDESLLEASSSKQPIKFEDAKFDDDFKILSKFQKFDMSGSLLKDFSNDSGIEKKSSSQFSKEIAENQLRKKIVHGNYHIDGSISRSDMDSPHGYFKKKKDEMKITSLTDQKTTQDHTRIEEPELDDGIVGGDEMTGRPSEFIGDVTLMELQ